MPKYLLLLKEQTTAEPSLSPEEIQDIIREYQAWSEEMRSRGKLLGGEKLAHEPGRLLASSDGRVTTTDAPMTEAKEIIGGFFQIQADDDDEALEVSSSCPHLKFGGTIHLRRVDEV